MSNNIEIIDRLSKPTDKKPIQLISCLQTYSDNSNFPCFGSTLDKTHGLPFDTTKIERICETVIDGVTVSLVLVYREDKSPNKPLIFLAHWNDGIL